VTFSGTPVGDYKIVIQVTSNGNQSTAVFKWSINSGTDYTTGATASSSGVTLGNTGVVVTFPAGSYTTSDVYTCNVIPLKTKDGIQWYDLPADFYKMQNVMITGAGWAGPVEVPEIMKVEEALWRYNTNVTLGNPLGYMLRNGTSGANMIGLFPVPRAGALVRINYFPYAPQLASTSTQIDTYNSWFDQYAVFYAAQRMAYKDEDFELADRMERDMNDIKKRIQAAAASGRSSQAPHIQNTIAASRIRRRTYYYP
jgi:hypothetical protein